MTINVSRNDGGETVMEVWNDGKKITIYFPEKIDILRIEGKEVNAPITETEDFYDAWHWVTDGNDIY